MKLIISIFIINLVQHVAVFMPSLQSYEWLLFDYTNILTGLLLALLLYELIGYEKLILKSMAFAIVLLQLGTLVSYAAASALEIFYYAVATISFLPFVAACFLLYKKTPDKYQSTGSFLLYRQPNSYLGLFLMCFGFQGSRVSLIVDGKEYRFAECPDGRLRVKSFNHRHLTSGRYFKTGVTKNYAESLCGKEWSWRKNCFVVFRRSVYR